MNKLDGTDELGYGAYPAQLKMLRLRVEALRKSFVSARDLFLL
jgi:hypothetical protein